MSKKRRLLLAIGCFVFFTFLFCLPGSALPKEDWLDKIWFDKWVHIGIFITLVLVWSWALNLKNSSAFLGLVAIAVFYGLSIEIIQDRFVPNRSFDLGDLLADFIGCLIGVWLRTRHIRRYVKNKPL